MNKRAFTLVEVLVVVSILGILVAIVLPMFLGSSVQTKEAAARDALRIMRSQIELYRFEHRGLTPGYIKIGSFKTQASTAKLIYQFTGTSSIDGDVVESRTPAGAYVYGPYIQKLPVNPFNKLSTIKYVALAVTFPAAADKTTGWLYKKETAEFKLNWPGTDSEGKAYTDY